MDVEACTWDELTQRAGSAAAARRLLHDGDWRRVCRDAYVERDVPDGLATRVAALTLVLPSHVAVSHRTALWLHGVDAGGDLVHVTAPRTLHVQRRAGLRPHTALLPDAELCQVGGLLVVTPARAVVDVARTEPVVEAVVVADAALRLGVATVDGLTAAVEGAAGLRYVERARAVLPHLEPRSESPMESRYRMLLVRGGLPRPQAQWDVYDAHGHVGRSDFHLDGVLLEYDGREQRLDKAVFQRDRTRQNRLADCGLEIRRFTAYDYYRRPHRDVCEDVRRALAVAAGRDRRGLRTGRDTLPAPVRMPPVTLADRRAA